MKRLWCSLAFALACVTGSAEAATLIGTTTTYERNSGTGAVYTSIPDVLVSGGVEFYDVNPPNTVATADVYEDGILFRPSAEFSCGTQMPPATICTQQIVISGINWLNDNSRFISGVVVNFGGHISLDPGGWNVNPQFNINNVSYGRDYVSLLVGGYVFGGDSFVDVKLLSTVPLPPSLPLMLFCLVGLGLTVHRCKNSG